MAISVVARSGEAPVANPTINITATTKAVPAHNPSMLSSRLKALVSPTTHSIVSALSPRRESIQLSR